MSFSMFSTPQQQQQPQHSPFQFPQQSSSIFPQQQQQQQQFPQFQPQQHQLQQQQQFHLFTNDKTLAHYSTKWADLHPVSQKALLKIEERILEFRDESQRLDQCSRLYDSSVSSEGFEMDAGLIVQELGGISTAMERQKVLLQELMATAKDMLRNTHFAVHSFMILRPRFVHPSAGGASNPTAPSQPSGATATPGSTSQTASASIVPVFDFYSGLPKKPSPFVEQTVARFEKYLGECRQWIEELEQLLLLDSDQNSSHPGSSLLQSLPKVMANVHGFFVHVASKVESIHQYIESMRTAYLADQRRRGELNDPFLEADRRETARQEAEAKWAHPTLHLPANSQSSTQVAGLSASSATPVASVAQPTLAATASAPSGSGFSLFSTPAATASSSLFATPTTPANTSSMFASSASPLYSASSSSTFNQASTPSFFSGTATPFTPATGSLFGSGAATTSNSSFGGSSKPKAKTRTIAKR